MIITRTPFRISFFGGGTDIPAWYRENGGAVLSTTIDKYCYISGRRLPPFLIINIGLCIQSRSLGKTISYYFS